MAGDPGLSRSLANLQALDAALRGRAIDGCIGDFAARPTFVAVGHFLHDPDHLHGHEVLIEGPAVGAAHRIVLHAEQQLGVGQFTGGNGGAAGSLQFGGLGSQ
ncbi:hypothetical protein D9M70_417520 [compost metagenome]